MPELPETETIARELQRLLVGRTIAHVVVRRGDVLRSATPEELVARCTGRTLVRVWRRAKSVVIAL
ncbi:MAG: DNA-formamidopyrimidine glycosylase family protein, partial [Gemmatimonadaceae bacterium]